jgi:hypothetical protein
VGATGIEEEEEEEEEEEAYAIVLERLRISACNSVSRAHNLDHIWTVYLQ